MSPSNHAIVYGASGIIGWAVVDQLLRSYPAAGTFSKVTAVTNRPVNESECFWPSAGPDTPQLELVSGLDLAKADLAADLKRVVADVDSVTHVYYLVFAAKDDDIQEVATNSRMLQNVVDAHNSLSPKLQFVAFPGGTRGYGIYIPGGTFTPPLTEDMVDSLPAEYAQTVVYPANRALLAAASKDKPWTWCEICPDVIVGFTPNGSQFSLALHWAQYLSLYAHKHNVGPFASADSTGPVQVPFPGSPAGADALFTPASNAVLGRFMIYASLHPDTCGGGRLFNVADHATPTTYRELWPKLAQWYGLVGVVEGGDKGADSKALAVGQMPEDKGVPPGEYVEAHRAAFAECGRPGAAERGVGAGSRQLDSVGYWLTFDRQLSLDRLRATGFEGDRDPLTGWLDSFDMFRRAGLSL